MEKFTLFTIHNPNHEKNEFGCALPGKGCAMGVEFLDENGEKVWAGLMIPDGKDRDEVAEGLEQLAYDIRKGSWGTRGDELRAGHEIYI